MRYVRQDRTSTASYKFRAMYWQFFMLIFF